MVTSRRQGPAPEDLTLGQLGKHRRVRLRCRSYAAAFRIVEQTDFVLTMPRRYVGLLSAGRSVHVFGMPVDVPPLDVCLYWHEAMDADPGNRWLRAELMQVLGKKLPHAARRSR
jgi:DNA-binding transcriptional LysR family regulator